MGTRLDKQSFFTQLGDTLDTIIYLIVSGVKKIELEHYPIFVTRTVMSSIISFCPLSA